MSAAYPSPRARAWRNLMVAAINAGLEQGLFGLAPQANFWPGADPDGRDRERRQFRFVFPDGAPCLAAVCGAGFDELRFDVVYRPSAEGDRWVAVGNAGFRAGEALAGGWLERREGAWLQGGRGRPVRQFRARRGVAPGIAAAKVAPSGYRDTGKFFL